MLSIVIYIVIRDIVHILVIVVVALAFLAIIIIVGSGRCLGGVRIDFDVRMVVGRMQLTG